MGRNSVWVGCGLVAAWAGAISAQPVRLDDSAPSDVETTPEQMSAAKAEEVDTIVVTGSRIKRDADFSSSNPVVTLSAESIQNSGVVNLTQLLKEIPALTGSSSRTDASGANAGAGETGLQLLNLRNLGSQRTLVLVNGRRHVASSAGTAGVDVDTIPFALIERIETTTGGASAIYGADGVSGVVNFITRRDFEGLETSVTARQSGHGDATEKLFSIVGGQNFLQDRGNVAVAFEYAKSDRLKELDRDFAGGSRRRDYARNPADGTGPDDNPNIPDRVFLSDLRWFESSRGGAIDADSDFVADFNSDGTPFDGGIQAPDQFSVQQGGDGTPLAGYNGDLMPEAERYTANAFLSYQVTDSTRAFGELKYSQNKAFGEYQPTFDFALALEPDYAFVSPDLAAALAETSEDGSFLVTRDNFDLGRRGEDNTRETIRGVVGLEGDFSETMRFETSIVYGQTDVKSIALNNRYNDRYAAALDAVLDENGDAVCRSNLDPSAEPFNLSWQGWNGYEPRPGTWAGSFTPGPDSGCVPINILGDGSVSQAARNWIMTPSRSTATIDQLVLQAFISGTTFNWFIPPGSPLSYVIGVEQRTEKSRSQPPSEDQLGYTFGNVTQPTRGDYKVSEAFIEIDVPVLEDRLLAKRLSIDAAYRMSEYNTIGSATTWKVGSTWTLVQDVTFRGTRAKATRAPNIAELFEPGSQTFQGIADPCAANNLDNGTSFRRANCAELLTSLGIDDPENFADPSNGSTISGLLTGNADLEEEEADTTTIGIVLTPSFAPGLSISIDWYDIELSNAINYPSAPSIANLCVDAPTLDNQFCQYVTRAPGTAEIVDFTQTPLNVARFVTKGYDLNLHYRLLPSQLGVTRDFGVFDLFLVGNKLQDLTFVSLPGADPDPDQGEADAPEWQASLDLTWTYKKLSLNYGTSYFDETQRVTTQIRRNNPDIVDSRYYDYDQKLTHDISGRFSITDALVIFAGINNFTDEKPDIGEVDYPVDPTGRSFFAGLRMTAF